MTLRPAPSHPDARLIQAWSEGFDEALGSLVARGERVAVVNFPNHGNAGDPALWLGEMAALERIGAEVVYRASWASYEPRALRRTLGQGTILIHAGANFGDLYPHRQATTRERLLAELADIRTVQLPQSIHFQDPANRERHRRLVESHSDFTLMTREPMTYDYAREHFDVPIVLSPDPAFALGPLARTRTAEVDVLWLRRTDPEAAPFDLDVPADLDVQALDWLAPVPEEPPWSPADRVRRRANAWLLPHLEAGSPWAHHLWRPNAATFGPLAEAWAFRGCSILARGRVVITDRLHGHILSLLQGIPHVAMDNSYGKVRSVHDAWTHQSGLVQWADTPAEAVEAARELLTG